MTQLEQDLLERPRGAAAEGPAKGGRRDEHRRK